MKRGWTKVSFGDVVRLCTARSSDPEADGFERYIGLEHLDPGELRVRRWGDLADGVTFTNVFRSGQVLFGKRRAYQRKVAVADFSGVCSGDIYVLEPKNDSLLPELLPFICQTDAFFEHAIDTSAGSLSPRTNWESLSDFEFALPPKEEQLRLVSALRASAINEQAMRTCEMAARALVVGVRHVVIPEPSEIGSYCIGDVARHKVDKVAMDSVGEFRLCGVYSFGRGLIDRGPTLSTETKYQYLHRLKDGVVVLSKLKAWEGAIAVASREFEGSLASPEYPTFELDRSAVLPAFMDQVCRSPWFWHKILQRCKGTAERRSRIHPLDFLKVRFPKLSIAAQVAAVDRVVESVASAELIARRYECSRRVTQELVASALLGSTATGSKR
jgi:type I restriction enzyme S subunit